MASGDDNRVRLQHNTPMKIATWNINSVRLRIALAKRFLKEHQPDAIALQDQC